MRSEQEMLHTILQFAQEDERVRTVIMNGSRANSHAPRDIFQDYDIVFLVSSMDSFIQERGWIRHFGELIIMQTPVMSSGGSVLMWLKDYGGMSFPMPNSCWIDL